MPRSLGGRPYGASEIGWSVQGDGPLENVVNLLFVLQESPYLHRVEGLDLAPGDAPGQAKVRFQFLTLVIDPAPVVEPVDLTPKITLASPERRWFDGIMQRDLLRPYVKRPPPPGPGSGGPGAAPPVPSGPDALRIVSLSEWLGQPEVAVLDAGEKTRRLQELLTRSLPKTAWSELSMGTSNDFIVATEEGATYVRIGEAILGKREVGKKPS